MTGTDLYDLDLARRVRDAEEREACLGDDSPALPDELWRPEDDRSP